jgi:hypothetical protein
MQPGAAPSKGNAVFRSKIAGLKNFNLFNILVNVYVLDNCKNWCNIELILEQPELRNYPRLLDREVSVDKCSKII